MSEPQVHEESLSAPGWCHVCRQRWPCYVNTLETDLAAAQARADGLALVVQAAKAFVADVRQCNGDIGDLSCLPILDLVQAVDALPRAILDSAPEARAAELMAARED